MKEDVILRRGITGFYEEKDGEIPEVDFGAFKATCFSAARSLHGIVIGFNRLSFNAVTNFYDAVIDIPAYGAILVLLNKCYPIIGFAEFDSSEGPTWLEHKFIYISELAEEFDAGYIVLHETILNGALDHTDNKWTRQLGPSELAQVRYWKPNRLGSILFNYWD